MFCKWNDNTTSVTGHFLRYGRWVLPAYLPCIAAYLSQHREAFGRTHACVCAVWGDMASIVWGWITPGSSASPWETGRMLFSHTSEIAWSWQIDFPHHIHIPIWCHHHHRKPCLLLQHLSLYIQRQYTNTYYLLLINFCMWLRLLHAISCDGKIYNHKMQQCRCSVTYPEKQGIYAAVRNHVGCHMGSDLTNMMLIKWKHVHCEHEWVRNGFNKLPTIFQ